MTTSGKLLGPYNSPYITTRWERRLQEDPENDDREAGRQDEEVKRHLRA